MKKLIVDRSYHMKCDICGKEEIIKETDFRKIWSWWIRHWSKVTIEQYGVDPFPRKLDLCPTCTGKFRKLVMNVKLEDEYGPECSE